MLIRRRLFVLICALALVALVWTPFSLLSHHASAKTDRDADLVACQQKAKSYADLVANLARMAGDGQTDLAAGTGDPGVVGAYRELYSSVVNVDLGKCSSTDSASDLAKRASSYAAAGSSLQTKIAAISSENCTASSSASTSSCASASASGQGRTIDWVSPSGGTQPDLSKYKDLSVRVSLDDQRVYVMSGSTVIYTMICSSGTGDNTPTGTYKVQNRGKTFFNGSEQMGANYWVSWKNYGEYLFHTVPTDENGQYIVSEALKLGHKASSGCIRLTVDDAKWFYDELPENTTVVIS